MSFIAPESFNSVKKKYSYVQGVYTPYVLSRIPYFSTNIKPDIGLSFGWEFKNKQRVQLSWSTDRLVYSTFSAYREVNSIDYTVLQLKITQNIQRLSVDYSFNLMNKSALKMDAFIGSGIFINSSSANHLIFKEEVNQNIASQVRLNSIYFNSIDAYKINGFIYLGLESDLFFKQEYILSLRLMALQGVGKINKIDYVTEYQAGNEIVLYTNGLESRGTGIYIELSRRFQLYPLKKKKQLHED